MRICWEMALKLMGRIIHHLISIVVDDWLVLVLAVEQGWRDQARRIVHRLRGQGRNDIPVPRNEGQPRMALQSQGHSLNQFLKNAIASAKHSAKTMLKL